jgi:acetyl esterase/lipase
MIFTHGNFGNLYDYTVFFNCLPNLVLWDYRGYGESSGEPHEALNHWDLLSVIAAQDKRFMLVGHSLGTNVTLAYLAAAIRHQQPLPDCIVLIHPFLNLCDVALHNTGSVLAQFVAFLVGDMDQRATPFDYLRARPTATLHILYSENDRVTPAAPILKILADTERVHLYDVGGEHHHVCTNKKIFNILKQINRQYGE